MDLSKKIGTYLKIEFSKQGKCQLLLSHIFPIKYLCSCLCHQTLSHSRMHEKASSLTPRLCQASSMSGEQKVAIGLLVHRLAEA